MIRGYDLTAAHVAVLLVLAVLVLLELRRRGDGPSSPWRPPAETPDPADKPGDRTKPTRQAPRTDTIPEREDISVHPAPGQTTEGAALAAAGAELGEVAE